MNSVFHISRMRSQEDPAMLVMDVHEELSDVSLQRMLRCIPSAAQQKASHSTSNYRVVVNHGTERTNVHGEQTSSTCPYRSEERRVGKERFSTCKSRRSPY